MEQRILIHAPRGRDAQVIEQVLASEKLPSLVCSSLEEFFERLVESAAAAIVTEEAFVHMPQDKLTAWLHHQPPWSDFPFIVLATKQACRRSQSAVRNLERLGNVIILERPVNAETLASAAQAATRARNRQYLARKQLEEISQTHNQLRLAQMAGGVGIFMINVATDTLTVSAEFCRMFGLPKVDTFPASIVENLVFNDNSSISGPASRRSGEAPLDVEYQIKRADDGEMRWISRRAEFARNEAGEPIWMRGVVQDVTDRKLAEATLRESEARFRALTETMPNQVWTAGSDGQLEWVNQKICEYCGLDASELIGKNWSAVIHPDDLRSAQEAWQHALKTRELYETEFRIRRHDGSYRWHLVRALVIDMEGSDAHWLGTNTDIEDQKAAHLDLADLNVMLEQRVAERTRDLDRIWRLSTDLMLVAQFDGTIVAVNPAWGATLGWAESELIGQSCMDFIHPDERDSSVRQAKDLGKAGTIEHRLRHKDGSYHDISWTGVTDEDFIHGIGRDVTTEKAAEKVLHDTESRLRQSQKMEALGQLTGGIAHDFNNLLQGITGSIDAVRHRVHDGSGSVDRFIEAATTSASRAAALIHRLLAFSRQQTLDNKEVDVNRLVASMEELLRRTLGPELGLNVRIGKDVWPVLSDENQLESAILNLAINARDAMPDGGTLTISTGNVVIAESKDLQPDSLKPGDYATISVADTGVGMSPDVLVKAFDPFFTTKPIGQGTGLGLSMIYGFAKQSEGHVRLESQVGKGTVVTMYLPRHMSASTAPIDVVAEEPIPSGKGETVLVLDDEPIVRMLITEELELLGYTIIEAAESNEALPFLKSDRKIDLLLSDVGLPGMNGRQVAEIARQYRPSLPVLFMTGYAEGALSRSEFLAPGMQMMSKPFPMEELAKKIRQILAP